MSATQPMLAWPIGCTDRSSCARHRQCMYINCVHSAKDIGSAIDALSAEPARRLSVQGSEVEAPKEWLIRKGGYWYRPNCQGYTIDPGEAGRYTKAKADAEASVEPWHMKAVHISDAPSTPLTVAQARATQAESDLAEARAEIGRLHALLEPFSGMAGELFARNWNRGDIVVALDNPGDLHRIYAADFFALRAAIRSRAKDN